MNYYQEEKKRPVSTSAVVRIVIWSVVLCILLSLFAWQLLSWDGVIVGGFNVGGYRYDDKDFRVGNGTSDEHITDLTVDWVAGSVRVVASEDDGISVTEDYDGEDSAMSLRWKIEHGELIIKYCAPTWRVGSVQAKNLTVALPVSFLSSLRDVEVDGVDCDVEFTGNADELAVSVVDGEITVEGDIGELDIEAVDGEVYFRGGVRRADVECVNAEVVMQLDMATELSFDQVNGNVTLYLSEEITGFSAELDSIGGGIHVDGFDGMSAQEGKHARWGDGSLRIRMDGVGAKLKIEKTTNN